MQIAIDDIVIGERFRALNLGVVEAIAASFQSEGQFTPIVVIGKLLVAGRHRVEAARACGWTHIDAKPLEFKNLEKEQIDVECKIVEVAENLMRGGLDQANRVRHADEYVSLTNLRHRLRDNRKKRETEALEVERTKRERAAALAKVKAEQDAEEKKRLQAEFEQKEKARKAADDRRHSAEESARQISLANENGLALRLAPGHAEAMAKQTGLKPAVIRDAHYYAKALGKEALRLLADTKIATQAEMKALIKLQKVAPKEAEKVIASARRAKQKGNPNAVLSPSGILGEIVKAENAAKRDEALRTDDGKLAEAMKPAREISNQFGIMRQCLAGLSADTKATLAGMWRVEEAYKLELAKLSSLAHPITQKRTGTEHRYATDQPKESKDDVRKSLGKDAKSIAAKLKAKKATKNG